MRYKDQEFARRERCVLDTAVVLFSERAWDKVTVAELAERAGIGKGTVYKHFASKEEILARLVIDFERECLSLYSALANESPPLVALRKIFRKAFDLLLSSPVHAQLNMVCLRPEFQERLRPAYRESFLNLEQEYFELFGRILERAIALGVLPSQPIEPLFMGLLAAFEGAMLRIGSGGALLASKDISQDNYLDSITDFMLAGILGMGAVDGVKQTL